MELYAIALAAFHRSKKIPIPLRRNCHTNTIPRLLHPPNGRFCSMRIAPFLVRGFHLSFLVNDIGKQLLGLDQEPSFIS
jgi:hypothetical protein